MAMTMWQMRLKTHKRVFVDLTNLKIEPQEQVKAVLPLAQVTQSTSQTRLSRLRKNMKKYGTMLLTRWRIKLRHGLIKCKAFLSACSNRLKHGAVKLTGKSLKTALIAF